LQAGIDVELPMVDCYGEPLVTGIETGLIDLALLDRAVARVLSQKCQLGLLDPDWPTEPGPDGTDVDLDDAESRALAGELARRSIVLLRNEGVLPLTPGQRVAVVGPRADDPGAMLGCYSFPRHVGVHYPDVALGIEIRTVLAALRADPAGYLISYAPGCPVLGGSDEDIAAAARLAADADVCTRPGCSAWAPRVRAATAPACGCPAARPSCSMRCWTPALRSC
jgi:beta-glucosidase